MKYFLVIVESQEPIRIEIATPSADDLLNLIWLSRSIWIERPGVDKVEIQPGTTLGTLTRNSRFIDATLVIETGQSPLTKRLIGDVRRWPENLWVPLNEVNWGSDGCGTRLNCVSWHLEYVAQTLLICWRSGRYVIAHDRRTKTLVRLDPKKHVAPHVELLAFKNYGTKCHERLHEVLESLGIDPNMDMTDFPWELLGRR